MSANGVVGSRVPRDRMETTEGRACRPATAVPLLRFKGFDGAWEGKKLGDMFSLREERNTDGTITEILSVMKDVGVILYSEKGNVGNRAKDDVRQYNIARKNDIVLNSMNVIIGSVGVSRYDGCISPAYYAIRPKESTSSDFWGYWFWRPETRGLIASRACGLMEIRRKISTEDLLDLDVFSPLKPEQQEVGTLLSDLDALIVGREQGLEKLRNLKKAMLEKMFPRAGAKVPEVRFNGFEGEWEKKQLIGLVRKRSESAVSRGCPKVEYEDVLSFEGRLLRDVKDLFVEKRGITFYSNDVLFGKLRPYLGNWFHSLDSLIAARQEEVGKLKDLKKALLDRMFV